MISLLKVMIMQPIYDHNLSGQTRPTKVDGAGEAVDAELSRTWKKTTSE
jgi:hypothetical protein